MVVLQLNITVILHQTITGTPHAQVTANHSKYTQATTSAHIQHISNAYGCAEWPRQGCPPHLMRETISGRSPKPRQASPGRKTHIHIPPPRPLATPSAGRTGGVLTCLIKSSNFSHCISTLLLTVLIISVILLL